MSSEPTISQMNEAIAKFWGGLKVAHPSLGHPHYGYYTPFGWYNENNIKYHSSWDWLMPVGKKIYDLLNDMLKKRPPHTACHGDLIEVDITCHIREYNLQKAHASIYQFIQWYNQSTQNNEQTTTG